MFNITVYVFTFLIVFWFYVEIVNADGKYSSTTPIMLKRNKACGGWGFVVNSDHQYEERKDKCYLTFRSGNLCCIYVPDCPSGFVPEIPLKPFCIYDIKNLKIGCVVKLHDQKKKKIKLHMRTNLLTGTKRKKKTKVLLYVIICLSGVIVCIIFAYSCYVATIFDGSDTASKLGDYFVEKANLQTKSRWYAHNGSKFDTVCVRKLIPKVIMNGFRIISLQYKNAVVLDSMLFTQTSLKNTVKMMGLDDEMSKGYYPYEFTDLNYKGNVPDKSYFSIDEMDSEELEKFEKWYEKTNKQCIHQVNFACCLAMPIILYYFLTNRMEEISSIYYDQEVSTQ